MTRTAHARRGGAIYTEAGTRIPEPELHARHLARQAARWRDFAYARSRMRPETVNAKAFDACAFSVHHRAGSLAVPSKLVGTSRCQRALRALAGAPGAAWLVLDLDARGDDLVASHRGRVLGRVQPKHLGWVRPLVPFGLGLYLSRVTGTGAAAAGGVGRRAYRLGCNVAFGHVGRALAACAAASLGGDGAPATRGPSPLRLVVPHAQGDGAAKATGVPVLPESEALSGDADDVILWRTRDGEARASVHHVPQHSPTGIEWGYGGSGPADLARSILLALAGERAAGALYQQFKHDVVARVPEEGGVLRAAHVRSWVARQAA